MRSDKSVKDVLRLCFVSFDPSLYLNEDAEVFMTQSYPNNETKSQRDLDWVWDFTSKKKNLLKVTETTLFIYMLVMLIAMTLK